MPARFKHRKQKTEKSKAFSSILFTAKSKRPLFFVFCLSFVGGREPTAALDDKARGESRKTFRLEVYHLMRAIAHTGQAVLIVFVLIIQQVYF